MFHFVKFGGLRYVHLSVHQTVDVYSEYPWDFALNSEKADSEIAHLLEVIAIDPVIPLLHIFPKRCSNNSQWHLLNCLFLIARNWKQHIWTSMEKRIKKTWYIYTVAYYSALFIFINNCLWCICYTLQQVDV